MKSFRRSKRSSSSSSSPKQIISIGQDNDDLNLSFNSPKKVIKALYDYQPQGPKELKFAQGDFFHVISEDSQDWWKVNNPMTNQIGMVPISYFEVFNRSRPVTGGRLSSTASNATANTTTSNRNSQQTLYVKVLFEFKAEKDDEMDIYPGENLIICAHHNYEWYIAKPINRLGGPGLIPVSYVKVVDLLKNGSHVPSDIHAIVNEYKIPTIEQWKDQTAKYQASTIPLGSITTNNNNNTNNNNDLQPTSQPLSANSQYFFDKLSIRSSLSTNNTFIIEAGVDSYQLDHGRYIYLVFAKLSNNKLRHLFRYYQDFYDLQVKLLESFPLEAGKIENSKRIIPSIPGPLINVNDSISRLRRSKLDSYLKELIGLPANISRSEEVLRLFEVLNNGFDREFDENSRPVSQKSNSHQDRLSQYSNLQMTNMPNNVNTNNHTPTSQDSRSSSERKVKVKFFFEDDIFVLLLPRDLRLQDLKLKLFKRLNLPEYLQNDSKNLIRIFLKNDFDDYLTENNLDNDDKTQLTDEVIDRMVEFEVDNDEKFQHILVDKCKLVILSQIEIN